MHIGVSFEWRAASAARAAHLLEVGLFAGLVLPSVGSRRRFGPIDHRVGRRINQQAGQDHRDDGTVGTLGARRKVEHRRAHRAAEHEKALDVSPHAVGHAHVRINLGARIVYRIGDDDRAESLGNLHPIFAFEHSASLRYPFFRESSVLALKSGVMHPLGVEPKSKPHTSVEGFHSTAELWVLICMESIPLNAFSKRVRNR